MISDQLADRVDAVVKEAQARILGPGAAQYETAPDRQMFEDDTLDNLITAMQEEVLDQINYAVMLWIKLDAVRELSERVMRFSQGAEPDF